MKKIIKVKKYNKIEEKEINYIPMRFILAIEIVILETLLVIGGVVAITIIVPYFFMAVLFTQFIVSIAIINSNDNPDYKVPWLFFVLLIPIIGFMIYFMFYSRKLSRSERKNIDKVSSYKINKEDGIELMNLESKDQLIKSQALILTDISDTHLYSNTNIKYYPLGEDLFKDLINDLNNASKFIFMEYFIIEEGIFWNTILEILKQKAKDGVEVRVLYDDIGCMTKLPGNYYRTLRKCNIKCETFSRLYGQANNKFNNRNHRKITIIDGYIGYTGGLNIADEYINKVNLYGHWKDVGIRLKGESVNEFTRLFLVDWGLNNKDVDDISLYLTDYKEDIGGYVIPYGDGPKPLYEKQVSKTMILNMLNMAKSYVYITTPYLIIDNELLDAIINASLRGIDVRIITPHIPDKKFIFKITRSNYKILMKSGVRIYEYLPGFIHAKSYISDDNLAIIGTVNLDYRSLVHHFENGVWIYNHEVIKDIKKDIINTIDLSVLMDKSMLKENIFSKILRMLVKVFSPLL